MNKKAQAAGLSIISNVSLTILKLIVGLWSGSVSILSEAIHSAMDLVASVIAFVAVKISSKEPDNKHPYGHGKYENISGVLEGMLILTAAIWIIYEAIHKLIQPEEMTSFGWAIGLMFFSALTNFFVSRKLYQVAKETNSIALEADALHLKTDIYTSLGVGLGILVIWITGLTIFDPIFAIAVALLIIKEAYILIKKAFDPLLDAGIEIKELANLNSLIKEELPSEARYSDLRARLNGSIYIIDLVLYVPPEMSVRKAHIICDKLEAKIHGVYSDADIKIHVEPEVVKE